MSDPANVDARASAPPPYLAPSALRRLGTLGVSLGARSNVSQTTVEEFSESCPGISSVSSMTTVTFIFDDEIPDTISTADVIANTLMAADADSADLATAPPSPVSSVISISTTVDDSDDYPSSFDPAFDLLDTSGLQLTLPNMPRVMFAPTPTSSPAPTTVGGDGNTIAPTVVTTDSSSAPTSASESTPLAPAPAAPSTSSVAASAPAPALATMIDPGNRWYVVTCGKKVGVFQGWNNTADYVVGVLRACYVRAGSEATAHATYGTVLAQGKVSLVL